MLQGKRIGVLRSYVDIPFNDPEIVRLFNQAVADLEAGGGVQDVSSFAGCNPPLRCMFAQARPGRLQAAALPCCVLFMHSLGGCSFWGHEAHVMLTGLSCDKPQAKACTHLLDGPHSAAGRCCNRHMQRSN